MVVPSRVVTDMMGEMERWTWKMLSLNTLLTPSLTDYTLHHSTTTVTPYKTVSRLTDLNPNISSSLGITLHSTVFYDEAESASLLVSGNVKINCCCGGGGGVVQPCCLRTDRPRGVNKCPDHLTRWMSVIRLPSPVSSLDCLTAPPA